jgi:hypothetical protein
VVLRLSALEVENKEMKYVSFSVLDRNHKEFALVAGPFGFFPDAVRRLPATD